MTGPILLLAGLLGFVGIAVCFSDLRRGLFVCIAVGFLQDPLRKMTPGEPVALVALVALFAAATFLGAKLRGVQIDVRRLNIWNTRVRQPILAFLVVVVLASLGTLVRTGSFVLTGIGLLAYLAPIPAVLMAARFARREANVIQFLRVYIICGTVMASGLYLSIFGFEWDLLRVVGEDLYLYSDEGRHRMLSGFFRTSEIAAWHAGMSACAAIMLAVLGAKGRKITAPMGAWICYFLGAVLLTSRRKILLEVVIFVLLYGFLLFHFKRGASQLISRVLMVGIAFVMIIHALTGSERVLSSFNPYLARGGSTKGVDRLWGLGTELQYVVDQNGALGSGAGTGSQGAQYFGGGSDRVGGSAESGPGKVLAELGIPGFLVALWMIVSLGRYLWALIGRVDPESSSLAYGFVAFLLANAGVFLAYHQIFGDPFVLLILGCVLGFLLARDPVNRTTMWELSATEPSFSAGDALDAARFGHGS